MAISCKFVTKVQIFDNILFVYRIFSLNLHFKLRTTIKIINYKPKFNKTRQWTKN